MNRRPGWRWSLSLSLAVCCGALAMGGFPGSLGARDAAPADADTVLAALERASFTPLDERLLGEAAARLRRAMDRLRRQRGQADRDQLEWLGIPLDPEQPLQPLLDDFRAMRQMQFQLEQDFEPFEQPVYQQLHAALQRYRRALAARGEMDLERQFERRRAAIGEIVRGGSKRLEQAEHHRLARHIVWLEQHLQAEPLVERLRQVYSRPNAVLCLPRRSLALVSRQTIDRSEPVSQSDGPLRTRGTSSLHGTVLLVPRPGAAPLRLTFPGRVDLNAVNQLFAYRFTSRGVTRLEGEWDLDLTRQGLVPVGAPRVRACTSLRNGPARPARGGPLLRAGGHLVDPLVAGRSEEAARDISRTVARRVREELQRLAQEQLAELNQEFQRMVLDRATRMHLQPRVWEVSGAPDRLTMRLTVDGQSGLGAAAAPPPLDMADAPTLTLHESFATQLANSAFRGQNFPTELDANSLQSLNDQLPFKLFEQRDFLPQTRLRVFLHPRHPLLLRFANGRVILQLRANRLELDGEPLENCRLLLTFDIQPRGDSIVVRREGQPRVLGDERELDEATVGKFERAVRDELLDALLREVTIPSVVESEGWTVRPEQLQASAGWFRLVGRLERSGASAGD